MTTAVTKLPETIQELFDISANHLLTQNERAMECGDCCYRTASGLMCAIGACIPDELYDEDELEGNDACGVFRWLGHPLCLRDAGPYTEFETVANRLQSIHDSCDPMDWAGMLRKLAEEFGLSTANVPGLN